MPILAIEQEPNGQERSRVLKEERHRRILEIVEREGRVVAAQLQDLLHVSGYTVRRDLDELAGAGRLQRVHGGALARSTVPRTYEARSVEAVSGKIATAKAAATLLQPDQVAILDGGSTALQLVEAIPDDHTGTFITHSPPIAAALGRFPGVEVIMVGGRLDRRAMVTLGAQTLATFRSVTADICFLGLWSLHAEHGISNGYYEEAEVERVMMERADRVVGLASREKLGTVAHFTVAPATALTHLATEPDVAPEIVRPFGDLGIHLVGP
jgi:DeoR/GlpR family transcriptional regulator of sugar metabolism